MNREATRKIFDLRLDFDFKVSVTLKEIASLEYIGIRIEEEGERRLSCVRIVACRGTTESKPPGWVECHSHAKPAISEGNLSALKGVPGTSLLETWTTADNQWSYCGCSQPSRKYTDIFIKTEFFHLPSLVDCSVSLGNLVKYSPARLPLRQADKFSILQWKDNSNIT